MTTESVEETLLDLETRFWYGDRAFYEEYLADDAVMVFAEPVGMLTREETITSIAGSQRWAEVHIENSRVRHPSDGIALLTYHCTAEREDDEEPYNALATSVSVTVDGAWKLELHQQTPDRTGDGAHPPR
jgi:hypothetical protein